MLVLALGCAGSLGTDRLRTMLSDAEELPELVESPPAEVPPPGGLRAVGSMLRSVPLRWDPVLGEDVVGYVVERAGPETAVFERIATLPGRFRTSHVDRGSGQSGAPSSESGALADGVTYRYRVRSFDRNGRIGIASSEEVQAATAPPPAPPQGLRAYSHLPRRIAVTWSPVEGAGEYVVYRSPSARGDFEAIARVRGRWASHHLDEGLGDLRVLYYRISAVNEAGGEGPASEPVRAVTKAEPLAPVGLSVAGRRLGANRLAWEPNVERDVAGYRLLRWRTGSRSGEPVATLGRETTEAWDEAVAAGEPLTYRVVAFDQDALESAPSEAVEVESEDYGLRAEPAPGGVRLTWRDRANEGFVAARVLRHGLLRAREIARVAGSEYLDREVQPGGRYHYQVVLERGDGQAAPASRTVEVALPPGGSR